MVLLNAVIDKRLIKAETGSAIELIRANKLFGICVEISDGEVKRTFTEVVDNG